MIKLFQFDPAFGLPSASPFCMKLETYLRMTGLPFEIVPNASLFKAPKGKMPYIEDQGKILADSNFIIDYLKATYGDPLDSGLSPREKAESLAFRRLLEENLYWVVIYSRWMEEDAWRVVRATFFEKLPAPLRWFVPALARSGVRKALHGHGMGRHSREEIYHIGKADTTALADFLGAKPFFMGENPTSLDASAYGFLANLLWAPLDNPVKAHTKKYPQFAAFCERMKQRYYPG